MKLQYVVTRFSAAEKNPNLKKQFVVGYTGKP